MTALWFCCKRLQHVQESIIETYPHWGYHNILLVDKECCRVQNNISHKMRRTLLCAYTRSECFKMGLTTFMSFHAPHVPLTDLDFFTENFQRKKKKKSFVGIRTHAHSFHGPAQLPLGYQATLTELCFNHTFNIPLILVFTVS